MHSSQQFFSNYILDQIRNILEYFLCNQIFEYVQKTILGYDEKQK